MTIKRLLLIIFLLYNGCTQIHAQGLELAGGNLLNGAVTGAILGAATMGIQNTDDFKYLRTGLGAGIIGGTAIGVHDLLILPAGQQFFISGTFNDGTNSSIIILLDTVYGAAGGALLTSAAMLIADRPILEGLRYGSSIGAWTGFGFGLIDAFVFAENNRDLMTSSLIYRQSIIETRIGDSTTLGLVQPHMISTINTSENTLGREIQPVLNLVSVNFRL